MGRDLNRKADSRTMLKVGPWILAMFVALLMAFEARAGSAYRISPGDVLELSVIGVPELHYKSTVTMEGVAFFPLIGDLMAQGRSLGDLRDELRVKLSKKVAPVCATALKRVLRQPTSAFRGCSMPTRSRSFTLCFSQGRPQSRNDFPPDMKAANTQCSM